MSVLILNKDNLNINQRQIDWLCSIDPSLKYQTLRDLANSDHDILSSARGEISERGWGKKLSDLQDINYMWGKGIYSPKWISTHYTVLLLRNLEIVPTEKIQKACSLLLDRGIWNDGGINFWKSFKHSETCVTGMVLNFSSFFEIDSQTLSPLSTYLLNQQLEDGGWNCRSYNGDRHSSFHTTISVMEGLWEYLKASGKNKIKIRKAIKKGTNFLLAHRLFRSHTTGKIVDYKMTRINFPHYWRFDILRALDFMATMDYEKHDGFSEAISIIESKKKPDGFWILEGRHPGKVFFHLEELNSPSGWITLKALRVLKWWNDIK